MTTLEEMKTLLIHMQNVIGNMVAVEPQKGANNVSSTNFKLETKPEIREDEVVTLKHAGLIIGMEAYGVSKIIKEKGLWTGRRGRLLVLKLKELVDKIYCTMPSESVRHYKYSHINQEYREWVLEGIRKMHIRPSISNLRHFGFNKGTSSPLLQELVDEGVLFWAQTPTGRTALYCDSNEKDDDGNGSDLDNS